MSFFHMLTKSNAMPSILASCGTLIAATPIVVWSRDSLFSLCRVQGSSMEPTLFHGDILVIRKADGFWQRLKIPTNMTTKEGEDEHASFTNKDEHAIERERMLAYERQHCNSNGYIGLLRKPPTPLTGNIVVFKSPEKYPDQWNVKRTMALGGESVVTRLRESNAVSHRHDNDDESIQNEGESSSNLSPVSSYKNERKPYSTEYVPSYSIWVESDNSDKSIHSDDCKHHGPVSKKLLVGIAEYRLWPPWRAGKINKKSRHSTSSIL